MTAHVVSLQLHDRRCGPMVQVDEVAGRVGGGLIGDSHEGRSKRGVLVVDRATLGALGLAPGDLREQITVEGLPALTTLPPDTRLRIGGVTLRVNGPCEPCTHIGDMIGVDDREAFRTSLVGRRGALCTVVAARGLIRRGDGVQVVHDDVADSSGALNRNPVSAVPQPARPLR